MADTYREAAWCGTDIRSYKNKEVARRIGLLPQTPIPPNGIAELVERGRYPSIVLNDVTLTLPAGGVTSIIGPNGAGKSTLLSMISRCCPGTRGRF